MFNWLFDCSRYLLVRAAVTPGDDPSTPKPNTSGTSKIPLVPLDPNHQPTLTTQANKGAKKIEFPHPSYKLDKLLMERESESYDEDFDEEDKAIFEAKETPANSQAQSQHEVIEIDDSPSPPPARVLPIDDWKHDESWVQSSIEHLMPPPLESSPSATMHVQRELAALLKEQESAKSLKELGWYMPPDLIGDNLFQWIVEVHSFDESLPIAKQMKQQYVPFLIVVISSPCAI